MSDNDDKATDANNIPTQTENYSCVAVGPVRDVTAETYGPQKRSSADGDSPRATETTDRFGYTTSRMADPPLASLSAAERVLAPWKPKNTGLDNLGNTCFMNAGLQCLLHTTELSHFFLRGFYKKDLNPDNPLGCKGKLAEAFNLLVDQAHSHSSSWSIPRDQWGYARNSVSPHYVKRRVAAFSTQFEGFNQHDSQELICFLLDGIHEDLNRVKKKPYVENVVGDGTNDTDIAREAWDRYKLRNDSFVVDTFQGQMRSRVTCTECHNMSVSFDPSMYLSVHFKKLVGVKTWKCAVKFMDPSAPRAADLDNPLDFSDMHKLPEGFCFDCLVAVTVKEGITFGGLVKMFEERCPGRRFIALTWVHEYNTRGFKEFLQARAELPEKPSDNCVILEAPPLVADGWWEMSGLTPPVNRWLQKPKPSLLSDIRSAAKLRLSKQDPNFVEELSPPPAPEEKTEAPAPVKLTHATLIKMSQEEVAEVAITRAGLSPSADFIQAIIEGGVKAPKYQIEWSRNYLVMDLQHLSYFKANEGHCDAIADALVSMAAEADSAPAVDARPKKWHDAAGPEKPGLSAMVNLACLHVAGPNSSFLRFGIETFDYSYGSYDNVTRSYRKNTTFEYPVELQDRAVQSSGLMPVVVFLRKTTKSYSNTSSNYNYSNYNHSNYSTPDKHSSVDIASCFWVEKAASLSRLDVVKMMRGTIRHAIENAADVDAIVADMEADGNEWKSIPHVSVLDKVSEGAARTSFPEQPMQVDEPLALALDWTIDASMLRLRPLVPEYPKYNRAEEATAPTSLENLLQAYVEEEQLTGANQWRCPHCKKDVEATKQMHLWRSSDVLVVHLKRFGVDQYNMRSRLNTFVDVPLGEVDFSPYFAPDSPFKDQNNRYRLYAVSNHTGGYGGGHYYAYCRPNDGDQWVEFNDSSVHDDVEPVITKAAYILFFRRVNDCPRTLENLRAGDARCREDGEWMKDSLTAEAESRGACVVDTGEGASGMYAPALSPVRTRYSNSFSDGEQEHDEKREKYAFYN